MPPLSWLARRLYGYVATNRFALSKCRGGACRVDRPAAVRRQAPLHAFWTCYSLGMLLVSLGDFSRTELVRSFVRAADDGPLPTVFEVRGYNTSL